MATKEQRKQKQKIARERQKNNREKNKQKIFEENQIPLDFSKISKIDGIKAYVLLILDEIISDMKNGENNDINILKVASYLKKFAMEPEKMYYNYLRNNKDIYTLEEIKRAKILSRKTEYRLNTTERALLKARMEIQCNEYGFSSVYKAIDYGALRLGFELVYQAILNGLKEKRISCLSMTVGYGDTLVDYEITYNENSSKYNLNDRILIYVFWNPLDKLYNQYTIYKTSYIAFEESSINSLATAYEMERQIESRKNGMELVSFNGITLNYLGVLEIELKKLVSNILNINKKKLKLIDAINCLQDERFGRLSDPGIIEGLHCIRKLRNKIAHGEQISYSDFKMVKRILFDLQILDSISRELVNFNKFSDCY